MTVSRVTTIVLGLLLFFVVIDRPTGAGEVQLTRSRQLRPGSLCERSEKIIFNCALRTSGKTVSLCASTDLTADRGYIQYRFGRPSKVELEFPAAREQSQKQFGYSHYFRAQVDRTEISFTSADFTYTLFDTYNGEEKPVITEEGVTITPTSGGKDVTLRCKGKAKADLGNLEEIFPQQ